MKNSLLNENALQNARRFYLFFKEKLSQIETKNLNYFKETLYL